MIKAGVNREKGLVRLKCKGTGEVLTTEIIALIKAMYLELKRQNEDAADVFRRCVIAAAIDPDSPMWGKKEN